MGVELKMPTMDSSAMSRCQPISPASLREQICDGRKPLLLDCRSQADFRDLHIEDAISVAPMTTSLIWRRLRKGTLSITSVIQSSEGKEKFNQWCRSHTIVLYDDNTADSKPNQIITLLHKKLEDEGYSTRYLSGGFGLFRKLFPEFCVDQSKDPGNSLTNAIYELSCMNLTNDGQGTSPSADDNPVEVIPGLYLGNAKSSANLEGLTMLRIRYILNVTCNMPNVYENDKRFTYMQLRIDDHWSQNLSAFFPQSINFIDEGRQKGYGVLVHCLAGISRSVTIVVAYLMQRMAMSLNDAYDLVKRSKSDISPNFNFMGQLLDFEAALKQARNNSTCGQSDVTAPSTYHGFFTTPVKKSPVFDLEHPAFPTA